MQRIEVYKRVNETDWTATPILIEEAFDVKVKTGIGKIKDTFDFAVSNANDKLFRKFYSGNSSTKVFTLPYAPPTDILGTSKFQVYANSVLMSYPSIYTISGTTLTFVVPPGTGINNIEVRFEVISVDDKVKVYIWQDMEWASMTVDQKNTAFQVEGPVTEPSVRIGSDGRFLEIKGVGFIETVFSALAFVKQEDSKKWYEYVIAMIAQINQNITDTENEIYGQNESEWIALGNPILKHDGSEYPQKSYTSSYKRAIEVLEDLTQDQYTEDGQYFYYVKYSSTLGRYGLFVRYKDPEIDAADLIDQTTNTYTVRGQRASDDVVNAIIYNCGTDPNGHGMEFVNVNYNLLSLGMKWKYVTSTAQLGDTILNMEFEANDANWEKTPDGNRKENFPKNTSYPYTFETVYYRDGIALNVNKRGSGTPVDNDTITDDDEFSDAVRFECQIRGREMTQKILDLYGNPRYKITWSRSQTNAYARGTAFYTTLPSFNLYNKPLRLMDIESTFWETTLEFQEDETIAVGWFNG